MSQQNNPPQHQPPQPYPPQAQWAPPPARRRFPLRAASIVALAVAAAGFGVSFRVWSRKTENGVVVDETNMDFAPFLMGPAAIIAGIVALATASKAREEGRSTGLNVGMGLLAVAIGLLHIVRGVAAWDPS